MLKGFEDIRVFHPTIGAVYYKLHSMGAIPENNTKMYKGLVRMLTEVRMEGNDVEVRPDTFSDDSRPEPQVIEKVTPKQFAEVWTNTIGLLHKHYKPTICFLAKASTK